MSISTEVIQRKIRKTIKKNSTKYLVIEYVSILVLVLFFVLKFNFYWCEDQSMKCLAAVGESISSNIDRGDVVSIKTNEGLMIRRVIGLPGDIITIDAGNIYINGQKIKEEYYEGQTYANGIINYVIPDNEMFVLSDNRNKFADSILFGSVPISNIKERIILLL